MILDPFPALWASFPRGGARRKLPFIVCGDSTVSVYYYPLAPLRGKGVRRTGKGLFVVYLMGFIIAAAAEMSIVSKMVRVPELHSLIIGIMAQSPLRAKLQHTAIPTLWSFFEGGMTMAINIP